MKKLQLRREVLRTLSKLDLSRIAGGVPALTDGQNGCRSEATGCPTVTDWSCYFGSCTAKSDQTTA